MVYTLAQINAAWKQYQDHKCFSFLKDGKWTHRPMGGGYIPSPEGCRAAKMRNLMDVMDFPEYLEKHYKA